MAVAKPKLKHELTITIELSVDEACALGAICGYGAKDFIECFKKNMGTHYIRDYEKCIPGLFDSLRGLDTKIRDFQRDLSKVTF